MVSTPTPFFASKKKYVKFWCILSSVSLTLKQVVDSKCKNAIATQVYNISPVKGVTQMHLMRSMTQILDSIYYDDSEVEGDDDRAAYEIKRALGTLSPMFKTARGSLFIYLFNIFFFPLFVLHFYGLC